MKNRLLSETRRVRRILNNYVDSGEDPSRLYWLEHILTIADDALESEDSALMTEALSNLQEVRRDDF